MKGTFITPLHEDLHSKLNRFHLYVPNIFIFHFLKDSNEEQMVKMLYSLLYTIFGLTLEFLFTEARN